MAMPLWIVKLIKLGFPNLFTFSRMTRLPLIGALADKALFEGDDIVYLPKESLVPVNREVEMKGDIVLPSRVIERFIGEASRLWIMDKCICRDSLSCKDYPAELGCLFMGEATGRINPALGREVTKDEAREHLEKCREAGLVHMIGRNKLDSVWLWARPGEKLLTICNCCPCCCLWRAAPHFAPHIGDKIGPMPGVEVSVSEDCVGCGTCADACFVGAISFENGRAVIGGDCKGCGRCVEACPSGAIDITLPSGDDIDAAVQRIAALVDVK